MTHTPLDPTPAKQLDARGLVVVACNCGTYQSPPGTETRARAAAKAHATAKNKAEQHDGIAAFSDLGIDGQITIFDLLMLQEARASVAMSRDPRMQTHYVETTNALDRET